MILTKLRPVLSSFIPQNGSKLIINFLPKTFNYSEKFKTSLFDIRFKASKINESYKYFVLGISHIISYKVASA